MTHKGAHGHGEMVVLAELAETLLAELPQHDAGRAARTIERMASATCSPAIASGADVSHHPRRIRSCFTIPAIRTGGLAPGTASPGG